MTSIEWTKGDDGTKGKAWNPVIGCRRVSDGCSRCYAERMAYRLEKMGQKQYAGLTVLGKSGRRWTGEVRLVPDKLGEPLRWRKPRRVFVNSMSDLFHEDVPDEYIAAVFGVMAACPQHTFQVLTKRPERAAEWFRRALHLSAGHARSWCHEHARRLLGSVMNEHKLAKVSREWPLPNVWLCVSAENQQTADERIPLLLQCPAAVHGVSAEPLLGPIDFGLNLGGVRLENGERWRGSLPLLDWVIIGSESGPGARKMETEWTASIVEQCRAAEVACFVKQIANEHDRKGGNPEHWPAGDWPREFPRPAGG